MVAGFLFEIDDAADYGWIAAKAALPVAVTDHHRRGIGGDAVARGIEKTADGRPAFPVR